MLCSDPIPLVAPAPDRSGPLRIILPEPGRTRRGNRGRRPWRTTAGRPRPSDRSATRLPIPGDPAHGQSVPPAPVVDGAGLAAVLAVAAPSSPVPRSRRRVGPARPGRPPTADPEPTGPPLFEDVTAQTGIDFTYRNGEEAEQLRHPRVARRRASPCSTSTATACSTSSSPAAGTSTARSVLGNPCKLYRNLGDWKFEDVTAKVGLDRRRSSTRHGAAAFDYDRDGWPDLLVTGYSRLVLFHNEPDGTGGRRFVDVTAKAGLDDGMLVHRAPRGPTWTATGTPTCTSATTATGGSTPTTRPTAPTTARPATSASRSGSSRCRTRCTGTTATARSPTSRTRVLPTKAGPRPGRAVRRRRRRRQAGHVRGQRHGRQLPVHEPRQAGRTGAGGAGVLAGVARDDRGWANGSMGVDAGDFDRTGRPSLLVTNYENELPALYQNHSDRGKERFTFGTHADRARPSSAGSTSAGGPGSSTTTSTGGRTW